MRPRVAHVVQWLAVGGLERVAASLAEHAPAHGFEAVVVGYLGASEFRGSLEARGVKTAMVPAAAGLEPRLPWRLARWMRQERIDVVHTHHVGPFLYGGAAAALARLPHVHTEHSHEMFDAPRRRLLGRLMPRIARVVAVTEEVARFHRDAFGSRIEVVENGVAVPDEPPTDSARREARTRLGLAETDLVVGCCARLAPEKGHLVLLDAFARLPASARLVLIGDGPLAGAIDTRALELGIAARVHRVGAVMEPTALLPACDVVVLASTREGLPMALLEAMAAGVPVVATAVGGVPELLARGRGVLVPPADPVALGSALQDLLADPARRARLSVAARSHVATRHSASVPAARYASIYREQLATWRRPCE